MTEPAISRRSRRLTTDACPGRDRDAREAQGTDGDRAAYQLAVGNIRASARFLLHSIGPQAARRAIAETTLPWRTTSNPNAIAAHAMKEI